MRSASAHHGWLEKKAEIHTWTARTPESTEVAIGCLLSISFMKYSNYYTPTIYVEYELVKLLYRNSWHE